MTAAEELCAELAIGGYFGKAITTDSDVKLNRPGGTDLTFKDVSWDDESFESPFYWGLRLTYWFKNSPNWGLAADFTHAKIIAKLDESVAVTGTRAGVPVNTTEPLNTTFSRLELTNGHNLLFVNGFYRWFPKGERDDTFLGRLQPYVGLGAGVAYPHVEVIINGDRTYNYQLAGPAVQGNLGVNFDVWKRLGVYLEYKLSYADIKGDLTGGGTIELKPWTHHFILGLAYSFF